MAAIAEVRVLDGHPTWTVLEIVADHLTMALLPSDPPGLGLGGFLPHALDRLARLRELAPA